MSNIYKNKRTARIGVFAVAHATYWDQFEDGVVDKVSNKVYDTMLKTYGQKDGMQSYGTVVDLLAAYYLE